ncbi:MAG: helix-turn-helix transcriptional regulator [Nigerium sp.]|nr:helix-turn-helix transcriptional regulator [Nigerium sp.]
MSEPRTLRRDARANAAKLQTAAREVFLAKGLDAPLDEIARAAGVSTGTLYNHFGSREALIDAVIPEVAGARMHALGAAVEAEATAAGRLQAFVLGMIQLQQDDPALNDALLRRYPDAVALTGVCDQSALLGRQLVRDAHAEGTLASDFTEDDLLALLWLAGTAGRDRTAPSSWRHVVTRSITSALSQHR